LSAQVTELEKDLQVLVTALAPGLLGICAISVVTAARILGETGDTRRFRSQAAYAPGTTGPPPSRPPAGPGRCSA
jgi:transposase